MPLAYDEFGVPKVEASQNINGLNNPFGFTGYQIDNVTGLNFAQARYYDPHSSRMISKDWHWGPHNMIFGDSPQNFVPDISAIAQSTNLYAYCVNNPIRFIDPSGLNFNIQWPSQKEIFVQIINDAIEGVSQAAKQVLDDIVQVGKNFFPAVAAGIQVEGMRGEGIAFSLEFKGAVDVSLGRYDKTVYSASILEWIIYGRNAFAQENVKEFIVDIDIIGFGVEADISGLRSSDLNQWNNYINAVTPLDLIRELLDPNFQPSMGASIFVGRGLGGRVSWNNAEFRRRLFEGICN